MACPFRDGSCRRYWEFSHPQGYAAFHDSAKRQSTTSDYNSFADWPQLNVIVKVQVERRKGEEVTHKTRFYITSLSNGAQQALSTVRRHWCIENQLHWVLDVVFREDHSRVRKGNGAQNFGSLRRLALSLLQQERTAKVGVKAKRLKAALDEDYLLKVLSG